MYYFEVLVASQRYHGDKRLSYQFEERLPNGTVVAVRLQNTKALAVVVKEIAQPNFITKNIEQKLSSKPLPLELLGLIGWMINYYPAPLGFLTALILPSFLLQTSRNQASISNEALKLKLPKLTLEQKQAMKSITASESKSILLHGDTGSGKTRVYLELIAQCLKHGQSAIVLTPEIGLTPQLSRALSEAISNVVILHSGLTQAQRRDRWNHIHFSNKPVVVVGPRSALFAPLSNVGIIIVDEAHDHAYKQDSVPHYQTTRVAAALAKLHNARFILGTATPAVSDYYVFEKKRLPIIRMSSNAITSDFKLTNHVVNLSDRQKFSRSRYLSDALIDAVGSSFQNKTQSLIFLNRRGTSRIVLCESCGWKADCPNCDLPLTYHGDSHLMRCHICNFSQLAPTDCPKCHHTDIGFIGPGTKLLETELGRLFPKAKIRRFDTDLKKTESLGEAYETIRSGEVDILVGTQMLTKGLDLPSLGLVGIVVADSSLYLPDFSAEEQSFQLLSQIMGRVGRGHRNGHIVIQTYHPKHLALSAAITNDYLSFYRQQIDERERFGYPPFVYLLKIQASRRSSASAEKAITDAIKQIRDKRLYVEIVGPSPAFHIKQRGKYTWQAVIKAKDRNNLLTAAKLLPKTIYYDIDPVSLL